jgi:NADH:ubiquinone oxidoreductase subunit E
VLSRRQHKPLRRKSHSGYIVSDIDDINRYERSGDFATIISQTPQERRAASHAKGGDFVSIDASAALGRTPDTTPGGEPAFDLQPLERILAEYHGRKGAVIPILQQIQEAYGYLPRDILEITSKRTRIPLSQLYGVATFYAQFHLTRRGRHLIRICDGTACHVRGAAKTVQAIENAFGMQPGGTSTDYKYTLEIVYCVGSCGLAPVAVVDNKVYGQTQPEPLVRKLKKLE